jgi:beta-mannosidase
MDRHALNEGWRLTAVGGLDAVPEPLKEQLVGPGVAATTPGCVHTDLMAAGLLPDPYLGFNDREQVWIGHVDWRYTLRFDLPDTASNRERLDLVCQGLDTVATACVNGATVGESANMHVPQRFDLNAVVRDVGNELTITFGSPLKYAQQMSDRLGWLPHTFTKDVGNPKVPYNMIRKMACNFGWDWGPALVTAGIWKPIYLESWNSARIGSVRPLMTHADAGHAVIDLHVDTHASSKEAQDVEACYELLAPAPRDTPGGVPGETGEPVASSSATVRPGDTAGWSIRVDAPDLWWPAGHGEQPLYTLRITLRNKDGEPVDRVEKRIGLRAVELVTTDDSDHGGSTFHFKINGKRIYCKGANWIPDDCFPHRVTPERYRQRLTQARQAHMNMLRVWGGGLYESDEFYGLCDELGIMVWQDLLTACAAYPEEPPFPALFEQEARHHIGRLSSHPSLVLWNGGNECIWAAFDWGPDWKSLRAPGTRGWGLGYWMKLFPDLLRELDPSRPYWPNSPYSGLIDTHPNSEDAGNCHHWDVWNGHGEYDNYLTHRPRFAAEFGFHGPPTWPTLDRSVPPSDRAWDAPGMHHHNRQDGGQQRAHRLVRAYFVEPDNFDDWFYLAQLNQARALTLGCEWFRAQSPWNSGALYWQLNDCWPVASWSAIDGDGRPKPLWFATRRFFRDRLITIQPREKVPDDTEAGPLAVCFHNDHDDAWSGDCKVRLVGFNGQTLDEHTRAVAIEPRGSLRFDVPDSFHGRPDALLVAEIQGQRSIRFFHRDKDLSYPAPDFDARLTRGDGQTRLTITAKTLLRDLIIYPDRLDPDAAIDDQVITLLPGESHTFTITTDRELTADDLTTRPVMQLANYYGKRQVDRSGVPLAEARRG